MFIIVSLLEFALAEYVTLGSTESDLFKWVLYGAIANNLIFLLHIIAQAIAFKGIDLFKHKKAIYFEIVL
jgi:hypothetical protein